MWQKCGSENILKLFRMGYIWADVFLFFFWKSVSEIPDPNQIYISFFCIYQFDKKKIVSEISIIIILRVIWHAVCLFLQ